jgi:chemotaxis protein CheC
MEALVHAALLNATRGLSEFLELPITTGTPQARVIRFGEMFQGIGDPESETVGVYLRMKGALSGQAILILPLTSALHMADLLVGSPPGTSSSLNDVERSALGEAGHIMVSYFLNAMYTLTGKPLRPSTPAVMVDMLGAVLNVLATTVGELRDDLMIIELIFQNSESLIEGRFWVLPDLVSQFE